MKLKENLKQKIFREVCKIPRGKTKTYKEIAKAVKTNPRVVARILSQNLNPIKIPCHRVVRSDGKIGGYTFKGKRKDKIKIKFLRKEGVKIKDRRLSKIKVFQAFNCIFFCINMKFQRAQHPFNKMRFC